MPADGWLRRVSGSPLCVQRGCVQASEHAPGALPVWITRLDYESLACCIYLVSIAEVMRTMNRNHAKLGRWELAINGAFPAGRCDAA